MFQPLVGGCVCCGMVSSVAGTVDRDLCKCLVLDSVGGLVSPEHVGSLASRLWDAFEFHWILYDFRGAPCGVITSMKEPYARCMARGNMECSK